jgi:uncharacterized RDD family membrane protein YckC
VLLISAFVVSAVYEIAGVGAFGQTLGKRLGIKVVVFPDGTAVGYKKAAVRFVVLAVVPVSVLGFARAARDASGRGLHDMVAGTVVVRTLETERGREVIQPSHPPSSASSRSSWPETD